MSRQYKFRDQRLLYFVTFTVIDWMDVFIRDEYRQVVIRSIKYCQENKGLEVYAYCFMTSHVHMIIGSAGKMPLEGIVRDLKAFTSRSIRKVLEDHAQVHESRRHWMLHRMYTAGKYNPNNIDFQFWQQFSHPIELTSPSVIDQKLSYIHLNPVEAGFVDTPEAWIYSSARDYSGVAKGYIELAIL
jgi:REP element-mobilizing transposase RayT